MKEPLFSALLKIEAEQIQSKDPNSRPSFAAMYYACDGVQEMCEAPSAHPSLHALVETCYSADDVFRALYPGLTASELREVHRTMDADNAPKPTCGGPACSSCRFRGKLTSLFDIRMRKVADLRALHEWAYRADDRFMNFYDGHFSEETPIKRAGFGVVLKQAGAFQTFDQHSVSMFLADPLLTMVFGDEHDVGNRTALLMKYGKPYANTFWMPTHPMVPGNHQWFLEHLQLMLPDDWEYVLKYIAAGLQEPSKKIHHSILVRSEIGVGKGRLIDLLKHFVGDHNYGTVTTDNILGKFWSPFIGKMLVACNELEVPTDKMGVFNKLKEVLGDATFGAEKKNKDAGTYRTPTMIFLFTNYDLPLKIDAKDRRLYVCDAVAHPDHSGEYFDRLTAHIDCEGDRAAVLHFLMHLDLGGFSRHSAPPMTNAKRNLIDLSRRQIDIVIKEAIEDLRGPFHRDITTVAEVLRWVTDKMQPTKEQITGTQVSLALKRLGCYSPSDPQQRIGDGERITLVVVRNTKQYLSMTGVQLRDLYMSYSEPPKSSVTSQDDEPITVVAIRSRQDVRSGGGV